MSSFSRDDRKPLSHQLPLQNAILLALFGIAILLRVWDLSARNLWTDEAWVALAALAPTPHDALVLGQLHPALLRPGDLGPGPPVRRQRSGAALPLPGLRGRHRGLVLVHRPAPGLPPGGPPGVLPGGRFPGAGVLLQGTEAIQRRRLFCGPAGLAGRVHRRASRQPGLGGPGPGRLAGAGLFPWGRLCPPRDPPGAVAQKGPVPTLMGGGPGGLLGLVGGGVLPGLFPRPGEPHAAGLLVRRLPRFFRRPAFPGLVRGRPGPLFSLFFSLLLLYELGLALGSGAHRRGLAGLMPAGAPASFGLLGRPSSSGLGRGRPAPLPLYGPLQRQPPAPFQRALALSHRRHRA